MKYKHALIAVSVLAIPVLMGSTAQEHIVTQKERAFSQPELSVHVGETVLFKNEDSVVHNVFSVTKGLEFDLRTQQPGKSSTVKFDKPGKCEVRCAIHPKMKIFINVQE